MVSTQGCAVLLAGLAFALPGLAQRTAEMAMPSCVSGSPPMRVSSTIERAVLDATDSRRFHEAAQARYPLYQRGGLVPAQVLMIRRGEHWQYVTLSPHGRRGGLCLLAVFAADRFDFTPGWLAKYEPRAGDSDD
mgnify:CR=1 FL=1